MEIAETINDDANIFHMYRDLAAAIKNNAKIINDFYSPTKQAHILYPEHFSLDKLFKMIDPKVFNTILFLTMSVREANEVEKHAKLKSWIRGEEFCLLTYDATKQFSHKRFIRSV